ncbi:MAG: four-carbon acid sugar kinase family protein [Alphaproteobacteria bacterium]|nr:four-carbon acid sugar kinase family protein [Alphaproteobacteria bacterium]
MTVLIGAVADDSTGATDLANTLVKAGMPTVQLIGVPDRTVAVADAEAVVVALKSRTAPVREAVADSLAALDWLKRAGAQQFVFKYCSTFDSTDEGNIGPVAEAMLAALDAPFTIACPSFPGAGRTVYLGHHFVGEALLSESSMRAHPLTPMTDPNLVRVLQRQTKMAVGLVAFPAVEQGPAAIEAAFERLQAEGKRIAVVDAMSDKHLVDIGQACKGLKLVTGGSGVAMGLPGNFGRQAQGRAAALPAIAGPAAILAGSCSAATQRQVAEAAKRWPVLRLDPIALAEGKPVADEILAWALPKLANGPVVVASTDTPEAVAAVQRKLGRMEAGAMVEHALAAVACGLVARGVRRLVVAGGETSGAVVSALGIKALRIGREIAPGVPCTVALVDPPLALALKSGNFGGPDFFAEALEQMP